MCDRLLDDATRAEILTGEGRGAVGVVRVSGRDALSIASALFRPIRGSRLDQSVPARPRFGRFAGGDEVVALVLEGSPPAVEIHGHGGTAAMAAILSELKSRGVLVGTVRGVPASIQSQAESDLARAETLRVASILLDQLDGALDREMETLQRLATEGSASPPARVLIDRSNIGLRLLGGWKVVLTGRPNVGKSRLLNAVAGFSRAIVSPTAGTTRDVVTTRAAIDGWPVELMDTAGIRGDATGLESLGIALARDVISAADLVVLVLDRSEPLAAEDERLLGEFPTAVRVANKADLPAAWSELAINAQLVSAQTSCGVDRFLSVISARLVPDPPAAGSGVPFRPEHVSRIREFIPPE